jgi:hypothetical protein
MIEIKVKYKALTPISEDGKIQKLQRKTVEKVLTLKELDQYEEKQHSIHFACEGLMTIGADGKTKADLETVMYLTKLALNILFVETPEFTKKDLTDFKQDGIAMAKFGTVFISDYLVPFFLKSTE